MIRYIRAEVEAADDSTLITLSNPLSALAAANPMVITTYNIYICIMEVSYFVTCIICEIYLAHQAAMIPGMGSKQQTVKEFDTLKLNEMSQGLMFEIMPAMFMHFVKKSG